MDKIRNIAQKTINEYMYLHYTENIDDIMKNVFEQSNPDNRLCFNEMDCYEFIQTPRELWELIQFHHYTETTIMDVINKVWEKVGYQLIYKPNKDINIFE